MEPKYSRPITQLADSPHKTHEICISAFNSVRQVSPALLSYCSQFYQAYLSRHDDDTTTSRCAHCQTDCLPYVYSPFEVNLLLDFLERTPQAAFPGAILFSLIRLCDYLLINGYVISDVMHIYIPRRMRERSPFTEALVESFYHLGGEFASLYFG